MRFEQNLAQISYPGAEVSAVGVHCTVNRWRAMHANGEFVDLAVQVLVEVDDLWGPWRAGISVMRLVTEIVG